MRGSCIPANACSLHLTCLARFASLEQKYKDRYEHRVRNAHAQSLAPSVPHSLPLISYTGTYSHPAYQNITVSLCNGTLVADLRYRPSPIRFILTHLTGETFLVQDKPFASSQLGWATVGGFKVKYLKQAHPSMGMALSLSIPLEEIGSSAISFQQVTWGNDGARC